ncbi:hypothetical protein ACS0PU_009838 [Formica fusca]
MHRHDPIMTQYKHKDFFHLDELTIYMNILLTNISTTIQQDKSDIILKKPTILMCCNASGTEKLPLFICDLIPL